ncbi:aromatic aminobenezylarsenical efflux permease ArsG family transporter [Sunxiuqinia sp. A32]|uniref:aromatic aminobenezylarsenical efflux permease ArsG family transporter n=1 Tax=Sunxiuqinia sp. A32 TaxID=3461496 RepID=UPI00404528DF
MQELFTNLLDQSSFPLWSAFLIGIITSLGPCTLTTNIAAIGFISKEASDKKRVLFGGIIYTAGRAFTYTSVAFILFLGANSLNISGFLSRYGELLIGPLLLIIGLVMFDLVPISFPTFSRLSNKIEKQNKYPYLQDFLLGVVFALAFCFYSGVMYFGLLIPMTITSISGLILPVLFALGTSMVVILFTLIIAFTLSELNTWFVRIKNVELWLRRIVAVLFIGIGIYRIFILLVSL